MKHQTFDQLQKIAEISRPQDRPMMTRRERLERWATLLEREPERRFGTFHQIEYEADMLRAHARCLGSPISVAYADPLLRAEGLEGDSYGQAQRFFSLNDRQLHEIVCSCRHGTSMTALAAARQVRVAMRRPQMTLIAWFMDAFASLYLR